MYSCTNVIVFSCFFNTTTIRFGVRSYSKAASALDLNNQNTPDGIYFNTSWHQRLILYISALFIVSQFKIMDKPDPPVIGRVTHCNVELLWDQDRKIDKPSEGRIKYSVQEEEEQRKRGFSNVYCGYARTFVVEGLKAITKYKYRVQVSLGTMVSPWSSATQVTTTSMPCTGAELHRAVLNWDMEKVQGILDTYESLVDVPDKMGSSPLMVAAQKGYTSIVDILLKHGADVSFSNSSGKDSLMMTCFTGHLNVAVTLKEHGASLYIKDHGGSSALHWAVDGGHADVVEWLLNNGADADELDNAEWTPLMRIATLGGSAEVAKILLKNGADVNTHDKQGKNVLMAASLCGRRDLVKLLVEHGANIEETNMHGNTALDFAESFGRQEVMEYLTAVQPQSKKEAKTARLAEM